MIWCSGKRCAARGDRYERYDGTVDRPHSPESRSRLANARDKLPELRSKLPARRKAPSDLAQPDEVAENAYAPKNQRIPAEVRDLAQTFGRRIGPVLLAEMRNMPKGGPREKQKMVGRLLVETREAVGDLQPAIYDLAVKYPMDGNKLHRRGEVVAFTSAVAASAAEEAAILATTPMGGLAVGMASQLVAEMVETWVAAASRASAYYAAGLQPTPELLALDIAEWAGYTGSGRAAGGTVKRFLVKRFLHRTRRRLAVGIIPVAGALANGATAANSLRKLRSMPLRPAEARRYVIEGELAQPLGELAVGELEYITFDDGYGIEDD